MKQGTTESKGFGFVGFDNPLSAQRAVEGMQGFMAAPDKFLEVDFKKAEENDATQYAVNEDQGLSHVMGSSVAEVGQVDSNVAGVSKDDVTLSVPDLQAVIQSAMHAAIELTGKKVQAMFELPSPMAHDEWDIDVQIAQACEQIIQQAVQRSDELQNYQQPRVVLPQQQDEQIPEILLPNQVVKKPAHKANAPADSTVYVFQLPDTWSERELAELFGACGNVVSCSIVRNADGTSKGLAFVDYDSPASAEVAVGTLNNHQTPEGKFLSVKVKQSKGSSRSKPY